MSFILVLLPLVFGQSFGSSCVGNSATFEAGYGGCETYASDNLPYCGSDFDENQGFVASEVCAECGGCKAATVSFSSTGTVPAASPSFSSTGTAPAASPSFSSTGTAPAASPSLSSTGTAPAASPSFSSTGTVPAASPSLSSTGTAPAASPAVQIATSGSCVGDSTTFEAGYGGCETYASNNLPYCGSDFDENQGFVASQVCAECGCVEGSSPAANPSTAPTTNPTSSPTTNPTSAQMAVCEGDYSSFDAGFGPCCTYSTFNAEWCASDLMPSTMLYANQVCPECGQCSFGRRVLQSCEDAETTDGPGERRVLNTGRKY